MKNLLTASFLILFLGTIIYSNTEAKVLPIIEGSELLDTLASQNNEEIIIPELSAEIYRHFPFMDLISSIDKYSSKELNYNGGWVFCYSIIELPFNYFLYLKSNDIIRFTGQVLFQHYMENI